MFDLIIIGAAAAGSSAAIYAARRNLNTIIISKDIGGEVALSGEVENWPGTIHTTGFELAQDFHKHVKQYNVPIDEGYEVTAIEKKENYFVVTAKLYGGQEKVYEAKTVLIGSGIHPRELGITKEKELKGKGVTYCTVCDGPLFKKKITATIGAGNSALESALMMSGIAEKVYLLTKYDADSQGHGFPRGENILIDKVLALPNIEVIYNANTTEFLGETQLTGLRYTDTKTNETKDLSLNAAMVHIGFIPNSSFVTIAEKNAAGEIIADKLGATTCPGLFAAGDVTDIPYKQISIAAGAGVTAVLSAINYLNTLK
mgnify:CR=1 FL=1